MVHRLILGAALAATTLIAGEHADASAQPSRPLCQQIRDAVGDAQPGADNNSAAQPQLASLDILSVDVATGPHRVAGVLRLKTLAADPLPAGATYEVRFTAGELVYHLWYRTFLGGSSEFAFSTSDSGPGSYGEAEGSVNQSAATVTISIKRKAVAALRAANARLTAIEGHTSVGENVPRSVTEPSRGGSSADNATRPGYTYRDQTPTCVKGT
jgi:hypothetical protein